MSDETDNSIREELRERLRKILSRASNVAVEALLESILKPALPPSDSLIEQLLSEKCTPNEIHLALIYCRNVLLMIQMRTNEGRDFKSVARLLTRQ